MENEQYDMSMKMRELFNKKQEQRTAAKKFWRKQLYNPYSPNEPFDPVFFRYVGASTYSVEHFRPNYKLKVKYAFFLTPLFILGYIMNQGRNRREAEWRSGTVAYEDRTNKLLY